MNAKTCTVKIPISSMNAKKKSASVAAVLWAAPARAAAVSEERLGDEEVEVPAVVAVAGDCCSAVAAGTDLMATSPALGAAPPGADSRAAESCVDGARSSNAASTRRPAARRGIWFLIELMPPLPLHGKKWKQNTLDQELAFFLSSLFFAFRFFLSLLRLSRSLLASSNTMRRARFLLLPRLATAALAEGHPAGLQQASTTTMTTIIASSSSSSLQPQHRRHPFSSRPPHSKWRMLQEQGHDVNPCNSK